MNSFDDLYPGLVFISLKASYNNRFSKEAISTCLLLCFKTNYNWWTSRAEVLLKSWAFYFQIFLFIYLFSYLIL